MYYWCIVDMLKIATHVYTTIPTVEKNIGKNPPVLCKL